MDSTEWHRWSVQQREAHPKKFRRAAVEIPFKQSDVSGTQGITNTQQPQLKPLSTLTISVGDVQVPGIPDTTIEGIWSKAAAIISKSDAIVSALGSTNSWLVESKTAKRPHLVTEERSARFTCDDGCRMWLSTGICAHSVAVADKLKRLPSFLDWRKKCKGPSVRLSPMVLSDTPKGAGKKGSKPGKKYGNSATGRIPVTKYASPFHDRTTPFSASPSEKLEFFLKWVSRRITVCQGKCQRPMQDEQGRIYPPPYDLCLARKE